VLKSHPATTFRLCWYATKLSRINGKGKPALRTSTRFWIGTAVILTLAQVLGSLFLPRGYALTAVSDFTLALLLLALAVVFAKKAKPTRGRLRAFWIMQSIGWFMLLADQFGWMLYDLVWRKPVPTPFAIDVLLFLPGVLMLAGFLLQPHLEQSKRSARRGTLDFLLLMVWWIFFYVYLVICWQYVSPNVDLYNNNYDRLYMVEIMVVLVVQCVLLKRSSGAWRRFYAFYLVAVLFSYFSFSLENRAIELNTYFNGSWYDPLYVASFAVFIIVALSGRGLQLSRDTGDHEKYGSWLERLAILAVLSLPVIVLAAVLEHGVSLEIMHFRVLVTAVAMFAMAALVFMKQKLLHQELKQANQVLEESSTTDPLTGIRNRRFLVSSIHGDVAQCLRTYAEEGDVTERDLIFYAIDLDNFKKVNDHHGHDAGDRVLIEASRRISSAIRNSDLLVRWGGEEFLVVSRFTDRSQAAILAERVLDAFRVKPFSVGDDEVVHQTCSIGWAAFPWIEEDAGAVGYEGVLKYADRGLYRAKKAGKNQAVGMAPSREESTSAEESDPGLDQPRQNKPLAHPAEQPATASILEIHG
jgi:diguanylate cyclase (GGDEF)-like protein